MLEVVSNPWRFTVENWLCDSYLVSPIGIEQVLTEKDLLADSYSYLEASIFDENEFLLLKVISTFPELSCLIFFNNWSGLGIRRCGILHDPFFRESYFISFYYSF